MNAKDQLPKGYTPIEYIEYRPKEERLFAYGHFERFRDALEYANHINTVCKESLTKITTYQTQDNVLFCIIIPEHIFDIVNVVKKEECTLLETPINVISNFPPLYRFLDIEGKYVDMFFEKGTLKLTTFEKCKELEDANRKDSKEGQSELFGYDGSYKIQIGFGVGNDTIMLCTSLCSNYKNDKNEVYTKYIEIIDVQGLLLAIADQLKKGGYIVKNIMFGPCFYTEKEFHKDVNSKALREKLDKEQVFDWNEMMKLTNYISGYDIYFQKPIDKRHENEFRLLWIVDNIKKDKDIIVTIPHPEAFCRLIDKKSK